MDAVIKISADTRPAQAQINALNRVISSMGSGNFGAANAALSALNGNATGATAAVSRLAGAANTAGGAARSASGGFIGLAGSIGRTVAAAAGLTLLTSGLAGVAASFTDAADGAALLDGRLMTVTKSSGELAAANEAVRQIAADTRADLLATGTLYSALARNAEALGATTAEVGQATKMFAISLKLSGADANTAASAIRQLGQAIGSNRLGGDEFASIAEANPEFMNALAASMGVARGKLKELAAEGKITGKEIKEALTDPAVVEYFESQFGKIPVTFADVRTAIGNAMVDIAGAIKKGLGIDDSLAVILAKVNEFAKSSLPTFEKIGAAFRTIFVSIAPLASAVFGTIGNVLMVVVNNMNTLVSVTKAAAAAWLALKAASIVGAISAAIGPVIALNMALGASGPVSALFAAGMKAVQGAIRGVTAALLANPFTALAVAITGIIALLYEFSDRIKIGGGSIASLSSLVQSFAESVGPAFTAIGEVVSTVFNSITSIVSSVFGGLFDFVAPFFKDFDFSITGMLKFFASGVDLMVSVWRFAVAALKQSFESFPSFLAFAFATAFNGAATIIEGFVNTAIAGVNLLISGVNRLGASFQSLDTVKLERMAATAPKIKGAGELWAGSQSTAARDFVAGRIARADQIERGRGTGSGNASKDFVSKTLGGGNPGAGASGDDASRKADEAKKKLAEIQAKYDEFFVSLNEQVKLAGMLPVEAERYNKELELRKILGDGELKNARELTDIEKQKIASALQSKALAEITRDIKLAEQNAAFEKLRLEDQAKAMASGTLEKVAENLAVEEKLAAFKKAALERQIPLTDAELQKALALLEVRERENYLLAQKNALTKQNLESSVQFARDALRTDGTNSERRSILSQEREARAQMQRENLEAGRITLAQYHAALRIINREHAKGQAEITAEFYDEFSNTIYDLANLFGGKMGEIFGALGGIIESLKGIDQLFGGKLGDSLKGLFKDSKFIKDLSAGFEKAFAGAEVGSQIAGLVEAVGIKGFDKTGAQIGGALGGLLGPVGSIVGSIAGGILGGLFKKAPKAAAVLTGGGISVTGNKAAQREAVSGSANSVTSALSRIAEALGGSVGDYSVSIGKYKDHFRVAGTATTRVGEKKPKIPLLYNGTDEGEAVRIAILDAINDGAITGISEFAQKALRKLDADAAIALVNQFNEVTKALDAMNDPIGSAVREINTSLDSLVKKMINVGASSEDLAKVEEYRTKKLEEAYKSGIDTLSKFREALDGQGSGVTDLTRLNTALAKFDAFKLDIAAGKQIDQSAFTSLGSEIMGLASAVYGTSTGAFQDIRAMLTEATQGALDVYQAAYEDATTQAINTQTQVLETQATITNDLLRQMIEIQERSIMGVNGSYFADAIMGQRNYA